MHITKSEALGAVLALFLVLSAHPLVAATAGTLSVTTDSSSPDFQVASSGQTDFTAGAFNFSASGEDITLQNIGLTLSHGFTNDLVKVSLYDGATKVGEAFFTGSSATSTLSTPVFIPAGPDKVITVKIDFSMVGKGEPVTHSGDAVVVNFLSAQGVGNTSGATINATGSTNLSGVGLMKAVPFFVLDSLPPGDDLSAGDLMRFKVTASPTGSVGITNFGLGTRIRGVQMKHLTIYGFTDANYSHPIRGVQASGDLQATDDCSDYCPSGTTYYSIGAADASGAPTIIEIPAGVTRYFEVEAQVDTPTRDASITTFVAGNNTPPGAPMVSVSSAQNPMFTAAQLPAEGLIWSPNSTKVATRENQDWTNAYGVLPLTTFFQTLYAQQ